MAYRTRMIPGRRPADRLVESVIRLDPSDGSLTPHGERIYVDTEENTVLELALGNDGKFVFYAAFRDGRKVAGVHAGQGWASEHTLTVGGTLTLLFNDPGTALERTWPVRRIDVTRGH